MTEIEGQNVRNTIVSSNDGAVDLVSYDEDGYSIWSENMTVMDISENELFDWGFSHQLYDNCTIRLEY